MEESSVRPPKGRVRSYSRATKALFGQWSQLVLEGGILYRRFVSTEHRDSSFLQMVVPFCLKKEVLLLGHDTRTAGHLGQLRTFKKIQKSYYWPGYREDVELWVKSCMSCQARNRPVGKRRRGPMQVVPIGYPLERVALDILGPLPLSNSGNRYVVVIMDYFTKWSEAIPIPDQKAETVARALATQFMSVWGTIFYSYRSGCKF